MAPQWRARGAGASPSGMLLLPRLNPAARNQAAGLGRRGTRPPVGHLHAHRLVHQRRVTLMAKDGRAQLDFATGLLAGREQRQTGSRALCNRISHELAPLRYADVWWHGALSPTRRAPPESLRRSQWPDPQAALVRLPN